MWIELIFPLGAILLLVLTVPVARSLSKSTTGGQKWSAPPGRQRAFTTPLEEDIRSAVSRIDSQLHDHTVLLNDCRARLEELAQVGIQTRNLIGFGVPTAEVSDVETRVYQGNQVGGLDVVSRYGSVTAYGPLRVFWGMGVAPRESEAWGVRASWRRGIAEDVLDREPADRS